MATVYSSEISVGTYNRIRLKVDYSGTSATCSVQFRRTSSYTTTWSDSNSTITFNGTTKAAAYSYTGTVSTSWVDLGASAGSFTISTTGGTYNWSFNAGSGGVLYGSGTITISAQHSSPTGLTATITSHTPTSITATASVTSWNNTGASLQFLAAKTTDWTDSTPRQAWEVATTATSGSKTGTNSNTVYKYDSSFPIKGCMTYYLGAWAQNSDGDVAKYWNNTARYIQPATPTTCAIASQVASGTSNSVAVTLSLTGAGSSDNYEATVTFYVCYRYSTDGGSTWTNKPDGYWPARSWSSAGTGKPWDTKTFTFSVPYGAKVEVKFLQQFHSQNSTAKDLSFTAMSATSPSGLSISGTAGDDFYPVVTGSITSYGRPNSVSNRVIVLGVTTDSGGTRRIKRERAFYAQTSGTATLNNSDGYPGANPLTLKGCQLLYPYIWANNQVASPVETFGTSFYTRPASPQLTARNIGGAVRISLSGTSNNESVTATFRYCIYNHGTAYDDGSSALLSWQSQNANAASANIAKTHALTDGTYDVYAEITYQNLRSILVSVRGVVVTAPPSFTNFSYTDTNSTVVAITGDNQVFIQGHSVPEITIPVADRAMAATGASMVDYYVALNSTQTTTIAYSGSADVTGTLSEPTTSGNLPLTVTARDNNGGETTVTKTVKVLPYSSPTIALGDVIRTNSAGSLSVDFSGTYSTLTIDNVIKNSVSVTYRVVRADGGESTEWGDATVVVSGGNYSGNITLWLDPSQGWTIQVMVTDALRVTRTATVSVDKYLVGALAAPQYDIELWDWHSNTFKMDITRVLTDGVHVRWKLNDVESIDFTVDLVQFEKLCAQTNMAPSEVLAPYVVDVRVRRNGAYIVGGQIVETNIDISSEKAATVEVKCSGFLNIFKDRYLSMPVGGMKYSEVARWLVEWAQRGKGLIKNPTGDIDASYWISDNPVTISRSTAYHHNGAGCIEANRASAGWTTVATQMRVPAGTKIVLNAQVQGQAGVALQVMERQYVNTATGQATIGSVTTTNANTWYAVTGTYTTKYTNGYLYFQQNRTSAGSIRVDDVRVYRDNDNDAMNNARVSLGTNTASSYQSSGKALNYELQNVKDALQELTTLGGDDNENFDFEFAYDRTFNCYHKLGTTRDALLVEYPGNISELKITRSASNLANSILNIGSGIGDERLEAYATDTTSKQTYGTHESVFTSNGTSILSNLQLQANSELASRKNPTNLPEITIKDGSVNPSNLKLGDKFYLKIYEDDYIGSTSGLYRVIGYQWDIGQNDDEQVRLTVEEA